MSHDATGPEPDYIPSVGEAMIVVTLREYDALKRDSHRLDVCKRLLHADWELSCWIENYNAADHVRFQRHAKSEMTPDSPDLRSAIDAAEKHLGWDK